MRGLAFPFVVAGAVAAVCGASGARVARMPGGHAAAATVEASTVMGTIQATVDGTDRTWYVVSGTSAGRPYASGLWHEVEPGRRAIIFAGYDTATPPIETFTWANGMPRSFGSYTGTTMGLMLEVGSTPAPYRAALPSGAAGDTVIFNRVASLDPASTFMMRDGQIAVTAVSIAGGIASATGTFSGTLARLITGDATVEVTNGRFEVRGMPDMATIAPHWSGRE